MLPAKEFVVIQDLAGGKTEEGEIFDWILDESPAFSPDGTSVTYRARIPTGQGSFIVAGKKKSERFDSVWKPAFSADGEKVAFGARIGRDLWWKVMEAD